MMLDWTEFKKLPREEKLRRLLGAILNPNDALVGESGELNSRPLDLYRGIFGEVIKYPQVEILNRLLSDAGYLRSNGRRGPGAVWYLTLPEGSPVLSSKAMPMLDDLVREQLESAREAADEGNESDERVHRAAATALVNLRSPEEVRRLAEVFRVIE